MEPADIVWKPQPRQARALACPADELLFGGAAGGGKSDFLLVDFLKGVAAGYGANYQGILFRRSFPELEEIIKRAMVLYTIPRIGGELNQATKTWHFPGGETLKLRFLESDSDVTKYQGHQYQWIGWDELGNYPTDYAYLYLFSRLRSAAGVPCTVRATANPGGPGHAWLKARFIDGKKPDTIYRDADGMTRAFIPSRLDDNQILVQNDPNYRKRLERLPPMMRAALLDGSWDIFAGQVFSEIRRDRHAVRPFSLGADWYKFAAMDWGYQKPYAIYWMAVNREGKVIIYRELYGCEDGQPNTGTREDAATVAKKAWDLSIGEGVDYMVADPAIWSDQGLGTSIAETFQAVGWRMEKAENDRILGVQRMHDLLSVEGMDGTPNLQVFETCFHWWRTVPALVSDPRKPEDVDTRLEDHAYDATRYGVMAKWSVDPTKLKTRRSATPPRRERPAGWDPLNHGL